MAGFSSSLSAKLQGLFTFEAVYTAKGEGKHSANFMGGDRILGTPDKIVVSPGSFSAVAKVKCDTAHQAVKQTAYTVGFVQNLISTSRIAEWDLADKVKPVRLGTPPTPGLDQATNVNGPWYDSQSFQSISAANPQVEVRLVDAPKWSVVTKGVLGDLVRLSGDDQFHVWLVAFANPVRISEPIYLGFACWEIEYIDVPVFSGTPKPRDKNARGSDGKPQELVRVRVTASGQGHGRSLPVLSGPSVNSDVSNETGVYDPR